MATAKPMITNPNAEQELIDFINAAAAVDRTSKEFRSHSRKPAIRAAEKFAAKQTLTPNLRAGLQKLLTVLLPRELTPAETQEYTKAQSVFWADQNNFDAVHSSYAKLELFSRITCTLVDEDRQIERLRQLLSLGSGIPHTLPFNKDEPWAEAAISDIKALPPAEESSWLRLLAHLQTAKGSKPGVKWLKTAQLRCDEFGRERFHGFLTAWLPLTGLHRQHGTPVDPHGPDETLLLSSQSELTLKGFAWSATLFEDDATIISLGDLGEASWRKIYNYGPRSKLVGNAVFWALSEIAARGQTVAVAQLTRIRGKLKHASARALSEQAMDHVAISTRQSREDLEELAVPTCDLDCHSTVTRILGNFTATLTISKCLEPTLSITDATGKVRKTTPTELKSNHAAEFKALQRTIKNIQTNFAAQRQRIESMFRLPDRSWTISEWRQRYVDHPLVAPITRRLIWEFLAPKCTCTAMPLETGFLQANGLPLNDFDPQTRVKLWHPCTANVATVKAWRTFLNDRQITQPFKQAYREVYLLTDTERQTKTYSNRFAAHIIRQHQFNALCATRGWSYRLQGSWDGDNTPTLDLPALGLRVEFWVENLDSDSPGVSPYLTTDQVRINRWTPKLSPRQQYELIDRELEQLRATPTTLPQRFSSGRAVTLDQISPQAFSEIFRDVDLFIAVCSVGNDPNWSDGGPDGRYRDYWQNYSFGDLSATAQTRRSALETILPRLAIAGQCHLTDKFLNVRGQIRTYKIHLGSGNILMEPNDQYLCIVSDGSVPRGNDQVFLPFEGDATLSVILSKALLLAQDQKITDPRIIRQIRSA